MFLSFIVPEAFICGYFQKSIAVTDEQSRVQIQDSSSHIKSGL